MLTPNELVATDSDGADLDNVQWEVGGYLGIRPNPWLDGYYSAMSAMSAMIFLTRVCRE